jgi:CDP-glucose 4,6-dehydratase
MKIAITGASGLLGSNLANFYSDRGHEVYILVKDEFYSVNLNENLNRIYGNVSIKSDVDYFVQKSSPDYFIHLAAQTQAYDSLKYPYNTFYINFVGTLNVLESLREYKKCKSIVVASSDKAYGELDGIEYLESHRLDGIYPYDASKSATDLVSRSYRRTYGMPVVSTRACNMYGVGDSNFQRLIPGIVKASVEDSVFEIRNGGKDIREYIHVQDVVEAYDHILKFNETPHNIDSFNISSGERHSTLDIFNMVQALVGENIDNIIIDNGSLEIKKQFMSSSLLKEKTGWFSRRTLDSSLKEVVDWYIKTLSII